MVRKITLASRFGLSVERVMRETDRTQQLIDTAVIRDGIEYGKQEHAALLNGMGA